MSLALDTNVLGMLCHPSRAQYAPVVDRLAQMLQADPKVVVYVPEIADYELRRKLLHKQFHPSIRRLRDLAQGAFSRSARAAASSCSLWR